MPATRIRLCRSNPAQAAHPVDPAAGAPRTGGGSLATQPGQSTGVSVDPAAPKRRGGGLLSDDVDHQREYDGTLTAGSVGSVLLVAAILFVTLTEWPLLWIVDFLGGAQ